MSRTPQTKGRCVYCQGEFGKAGMAKHLAGCAARREAVARADGKRGAGETLVHLRVQDLTAGGQFWLHLEARGAATLEDLDAYLRAVWLECCGHMSQFSVGGWRGEEIDLARRIDAVFQPGVELTHIYDFGTSTELLVKAVGTRPGKPTIARPMALMARNAIPPTACIECQGEPASFLCMECISEEEVWGTLCAKHAKTHRHRDYGDPVPLVNSPRMGQCGYEGPADPPY